MAWVEAVFVGAALLLVVNLVVALAVFARARHSGGWLLVVLLTGTTGAAVVALLAGLSGTSGRFLDVGLVLVGFAALTALVRAAAGKRPSPEPSRRS